MARSSLYRRSSRSSGRSACNSASSLPPRDPAMDSSCAMEPAWGPAAETERMAEGRTVPVVRRRVSPRLWARDSIPAHGLRIAKISPICFQDPPCVVTSFAMICSTSSTASLVSMMGGQHLHGSLCIAAAQGIGGLTQSLTSVPISSCNSFWPSGLPKTRRCPAPERKGLTIHMTTSISHEDLFIPVYV